MGRPAGHARPAIGGDICRAWHVHFDDGAHAFIKHLPSPPRRFFAVEAAGLDWLRVPDGPGIPSVRAVGEDFLVLDSIQARPDGDQRALGVALARMHRAGAPNFGWSRAGFIGPLDQPNDPTTPNTWARFYGSRRLRPMALAAASKGALDPETHRGIDRIIDRLSALCGPPEPPARLHGDLWSGNRLFDPQGQPWLVDPAPYGGHRELDLAMMRLFGGFPDDVFDAYGAEFPLLEGWRDRVGLYQLWFLLVHLVLFGASYLRQVQAEVRRYQ
jgi:fructosamine-3-kinase